MHGKTRPERLPGPLPLHQSAADDREPSRSESRNRGRIRPNKGKFAASFAADVSPDMSAFMADSQVLWGVEALAGSIIQAAAGASQTSA